MRLFLGGRSTIRALDYNGQEIWWTTVGDNVTAIALVDFNNDGTLEV